MSALEWFDWLLRVLAALALVQTNILLFVLLFTNAYTPRR